MKTPRRQKFLAFFLAIALSLTLIPAQVLAIEIDQRKESLQIERAEAASAEPAQDAEIVSEIPSGRDAYQKEFLLSNGQRMLAVYPTAVHYQENGQWEEIDNTLRAERQNGSTVYRNTAGAWDVALPAQMDARQAVSVEQDESYAERTAVLASSSETFCREGICVMERSPGFQAAPAQLTPGRLYRFLWNATAYGAKRIVLGEWDKDSLFNQLTSDDFLFADRLNALKRFRGQTEAAADLLEKWAPETGTVAVFRSRISERLLQVKGFYLKSALASLRGWVRSLTFSSTPFSVCSEESLDVLKDKKLLILPGTPVITNAAAEKILDFVHAGGILLCEPECGAWSSTGVPLRPDSRFIAEATGVLETARMVPDSPVLKFKTNKKICTLDSGSYVVPLRVVKKYTEVLIPYRNGTALAESIPYGKGKILLFGAFIGASAASARSPGLEDFLNTLLNAVVPKINLISRNCRVVSGFSGKSRMLFVFGSETAEKMIELHFHKTFWKKLALRDLVSGRRITVSSADNIRKIKFIPDSSGVAVLVEEGVLS